MTEPHFGYEDSEIPAYAPCPRCGATIRIDRLDLVGEHVQVCTPELPLALELKASVKPKP